MLVNKENPSPTKTNLGLLINPILGKPAFMARLFPVNNLDTDFRSDQLKLLTNLIHDCGGVVFSAMTDNLPYFLFLAPWALINLDGFRAGAY